MPAPLPRQSRKIVLKPVRDQVILITGASSGIGLATAQAAAKRGAKVILVARNGSALETSTREITSTGAEAIHAVADVADLEQLKAAAEAGVQKFGRIDTWINNAGVSIYGRLDQVDPKDDRRLFETNFWGVVNGSRLALQYLQDAGAIINVGSALSDRAVPIQGMYSASKHAVLGFTDALRMELEEAGRPIAVTLIKPAGIDTPYTKHAKNYLDKEPTVIPPVYAPEIVADAILHAAEHPHRDVFVGGGGRILSGMAHLAPRLTDWYMEATMFDGQKTDRPSDSHPGSLYEPQEDGQVHGEASRDHWIRTHSYYTTAARHPLLTATAAFALTALVAGVLLASAPRKRSTWDRAKAWAFD